MANKYLVCLWFLWCSMMLLSSWKNKMKQNSSNSHAIDASCLSKNHVLRRSIPNTQQCFSKKLSIGSPNKPISSPLIVHRWIQPTTSSLLNLQWRSFRKGLWSTKHEPFSAMFDHFGMSLPNFLILIDCFYAYICSLQNFKYFGVWVPTHQRLYPIKSTRPNFPQNELMMNITFNNILLTSPFILFGRVRYTTSSFRPRYFHGCAQASNSKCSWKLLRESFNTPCIVVSCSVGSCHHSQLLRRSKATNSCSCAPNSCGEKWKKNWRYFPKGYRYPSVLGLEAWMMS